MNNLFSRWLPAIAQTSVRKTALTMAGLAFLGGVAVGPLGGVQTAPSVTSGPNPAAVAAIEKAVSGDDKAAGGPQETTNQPADETVAVLPGAPVEAAARADKHVENPDQHVDKPGRDKLVPHGAQGEQVKADLGDEQKANARAIVAATKKAGMDERAAVVAIATSLQESKLENLGHLGARNDHDSQGLFQQRPSSGWGSVEQITDPEYSTTAFLEGLKRVDGWRDMPLTEAAQTVQVSAYPDAYAKWEDQAADIVAEHWNK